jgi:hypothetical protein
MRQGRDGQAGFGLELRSWQGLWCTCRSPEQKVRVFAGTLTFYPSVEVMIAYVEFQ